MTSAFISSQRLVQHELTPLRYHVSDLPNKTTTSGINYVITAFANSSLFASDPAGVYTPFKTVAEVRELFDDDAKVCMAIGGWGDTAGFSEGAKTQDSRKAYAKNVADTLDRLGYDCVGGFFCLLLL